MTAPALILDLGGVIVDHDNAVMLDRVAALLKRPVSHADIAAAIKASGIGAGRVDAAGLFGQLRDAHGSDAVLAEFLDAWSCHFTLKRDVFDYLDDLRASSPLVLCSNTNGAHWDHIVAHYGVDRLLTAAILSHEVHCEKPDADIYLAAARAQGRPPEECLFVDDVIANVDGAARLGFLTHHFQGLAGLRAAVEGSVA